MPWSPTHKPQTRERILHSAARLFTRNGYNKVGIKDVMHHAGLTRGAFYAHFSSKTQLYAEAILTAARQGWAVLNPKETRAKLETFINGYLSIEHLQGERAHCPLAFLTTDIAQREGPVRDTYTRVFKGFVSALRQHLQTEGAVSEQRAMRMAVLMIGGVALARAIDDEELAEVLLGVCREAAMEAGAS